MPPPAAAPVAPGLAVPGAAPAGPLPPGAVPDLGLLFTQRGQYGHTHLVRPPGLPTRQGAAGAGEGVDELARVLRAGEDQRHADNDRLIHALDGLRRDGEDGKVAQKGTLASIKRSEELDVYLARGCDTLTVEVCNTLTGRELFHGVRRACEHAKHLMQSVQWPTTVTNRIC